RTASTHHGAYCASSYALVLQFREVYHSTPGRRVANISVEGQTVIENFDILRENGNDKKTTITRRIDGINPAASGDKNAIDFTLKATRDNADVSAFVVLCTAGSDACAQQAAVAQVQREEAQAAAAEKAKAEAEAQKVAWQGRYGVTYTSRTRGGIISQVTGSYKTSIWVTPEGAVAHLRWENVFCDAAFGPGAVPEEMAFLGHSCNSESQQWGPMTLIDRGRKKGLGLRTTFNGREITVKFNKEVNAEGGVSVPPKDIPLDLAGVTMGKTVGETQQNVLAAFEPADAASAFKEVQLKNGLFRYDFESAVQGGDRKPEERFFIFSVNKGTAASAVALVRRWSPAEDSRPAYETLMGAVEDKYGAPTGPYIIGDRYTTEFDVGRVWDFGPDGFKRDKRCAGKSQRIFAVPGMRTLIRGLNNRTPRIATKLGCGWSIEMLYGIRADASPLKVMQFAVINHAAGVLDTWQRETANIPGQIARIQTAYAQKAQQSEARKAVKPKL
ncbi:MAG: malectin domain-containing carbohydrate-binding protein, partial [Pseudomonadota bacterium]